MRFPLYFKRRKGGSDPPPAIGSDSDPTFATGKTTAPAVDNVMSHKLSRPVKRIALGYWFEPANGTDPAVTLPVKIWVWDDASEHWYLAASGTLTSGQLTYLRCPYLADFPQTSANLDKPQHGIDVMVVIADNSSHDGTIHVVAGPDTANF